MNFIERFLYLFLIVQESFYCSKGLLINITLLENGQTPAVAIPGLGKQTIVAAKRRLKEEMVLECDLYPVFRFSYRAEFDNGLIENEYDHVYFGLSDVMPQPNPKEVADFRYIMMEELQSSLIHYNKNYTEWLKICFKEVRAHYMKKTINE